MPPIPRGKAPWNPTLAHRTRKMGHPWAPVRPTKSKSKSKGSRQEYPRHTGSGVSKTALVSPKSRETQGQSDSFTFCSYSTVMLTGSEGMPFAITTNVLAPVSIVVGTSKFVETVNEPVATPMLLWLWVLA
jgi:hypothetical protein